MRRFFKVLEQIVQEIRVHPQTQVYVYKRYPPVKEAILQQLERDLGFSLDADIRAFYQESNGLQFRWGLKEDQAEQGVLAWEGLEQEYRQDRGSILIRPLEMLFKQGRKSSSFDAFSTYAHMSLFKEITNDISLVYTDEFASCYCDSRKTDFSSYLSFLLATRGLTLKRKYIFSQAEGNELEALTFTDAYWKELFNLSLDHCVLAQFFPFYDEKGQWGPSKTTAMQDRSRSSAFTSVELWTNLVEEHHLFLQDLKDRGHWNILTVRGRTIGLFTGDSNKGKQAVLDMQHLGMNLDLEDIQLPYSSWIGVYAKYQNFTDSNICHSLFTDAMLEKCIFADTNLEYSDFSRANLRGSSFMNANLRGVDFENCDLRESDFRGAILEGTNFRGAQLEGVRY